MSAPTPPPERVCRHCGARDNLRVVIDVLGATYKSWECRGGCPTPEPAPLDLDALERLLTRATAGPWRVVQDDSESITTVWRACTSPEHPTEDDPERIGVYDCCADGGLHSEPWYTEADAELVAAARNALPELIRRAREAERVSDLVRTAREWERARADRSTPGHSYHRACVALAASVRQAAGIALDDADRLEVTDEVAALAAERDAARTEATRLAGALRDVLDTLSSGDERGEVHALGVTVQDVAAWRELLPPLPVAVDRVLLDATGAEARLSAIRSWIATYPTVPDGHDGPLDGEMLFVQRLREFLGTDGTGGRCLATWSITGPVARVAEQARIALNELDQVAPDDGPVKLRAELRAAGGDPR